MTHKYCFSLALCILQHFKREELNFMATFEDQEQGKVTGRSGPAIKKKRRGGER